MTEIKLIPGGVCAAQGFTGSGIHCGIRKNRTKRDLALILSSVPASALWEMAVTLPVLPPVVPVLLLLLFVVEFALSFGV